jgi:hypothetical protein
LPNRSLPKLAGTATGVAACAHLGNDDANA